MVITYVILHYIAWKDTIECAESILNSTKDSAHETYVVIVDNGSPDDSCAIIRKKFSGNNYVYVLRSDVNEGFARGNNIGYRFAKNNLKTDFIVQLNNDTVISQKSFNEVLVDKYNEYGYAVMGPDIVTLDGKHQNPGCKQSWELKELQRDRIKKRIRLLLTYFGLDDYISRKISSKKNIYRTEKLQTDKTNTILHGSCYIFSKVFLDKMDGMYSGTFLYFEEDILKLQCDYYNMLLLYTPQLTITHKEDVSTNSIKSSKGKRIRNKYRHYINSSKEYSKLKKEYYGIH